MSVLNFMTAIYWGQLSRCLNTYVCNPSAYKAVCTFSVFIFLVQAVVCAAIILWRNELIGDDSNQFDSLNGSHPGPASVGGAYENVLGSPFLDPKVQTSADL